MPTPDRTARQLPTPENDGSRLLERLIELEREIAGLPPGRRRSAAVELVVSRVRRLRKAPAPQLAPPDQLDLEELLAGLPRAPDEG